MGIRKWLLAAIALVMLTVCILTWGSLGSIVMVFGLIMMGASLAWQWFLNDRDGDDFQTDP